MATLEDISKKRSANKGKITKTVNKLEPLLKLKASEAVIKADQVKALFEDLDNALVSFKKTHQSYLDEVEVEDVEVTDDQEVYYDEVVDKYYSVKELYPAYLKLCRDYNKAIEAIPDREAAFEFAKQTFSATVAVAR